MYVSSEASWRLMLDCVRPRISAARESDFSSAILTKDRN